MKQISWCGRKMFSGEKVTIVSTVKSCTVNYFLGKTVLISPRREGYDTGLRIENGKIAFVVSIRWKQRTDLLFSLKSFLCFCFTKTRRRASTLIILFVVIPQKGEQKCSLTKIDNATWFLRAHQRNSLSTNAPHFAIDNIWHTWLRNHETHFFQNEIKRYRAERYFFIYLPDEFFIQNFFNLRKPYF